MKRRGLWAVCLLVLMLCAVSACAEGNPEAAVIRVNGDVITSAQLKKAMNLHQIEAALTCASYGYGYDIVDSLNILDAIDKVLFDLEFRLVVRQQAEALGVRVLSPEAEEQARTDAQAQWQAYREIVNSENGMAFLPAGEYTPVDGDPEENITRYLNSFGLTEDALLEAACDWQLELQLMAAVTGHLDGASDEVKQDFYIDWILKWYDQAEIEEDAVIIAGVCRDLEGAERTENQ